MKDKKDNSTTNYIELLRLKEQSFIKMLTCSWILTGVISVIVIVLGKRPNLSFVVGMAAFFLDFLIITRIILKWKMYNYVCPYCKEGFKTIQQKNANGRVVMAIPPMNSCPHCKKSLDGFESVDDVRPCRKKILAVVLVTLILEIVINGLFSLPIPATPGRVDSFIENSESISVDVNSIDEIYPFDFNFLRFSADYYEFLDETTDKYYEIYIYDTKKNPTDQRINSYWDSYHIEANINKDMADNPFWGTKSHPIPVFDFQIRKGAEEEHQDSQGNQDDQRYPDEQMIQKEQEDQKDTDELNALASPQRTRESVKLYLSYGINYWERFHLKSSAGSGGSFISLNHLRAKHYYDNGISKLETDGPLYAQDDLERAVEYDPQYADAWLYLGVVYGANVKGGEDKAVEYIEKARKLYGSDEQKNALCDMKLGDVYLNNKDDNNTNLSLARSYYEKASAVFTSPEDLALVYERIGETYKEASDDSQALIWFEKSNNEKETWDSLYNLGDLCYDQQNYSQAITYLEKARKMNPDKTFEMYSLINMCYYEMGMQDSEAAQKLNDDYMGTGTSDKSWFGTIKVLIDGIAGIPEDFRRSDGWISPVSISYAVLLLAIIVFFIRWLVKKARKYQFKQKQSIFRPRNRVQGYDEYDSFYQVPQSVAMAAGQVFADWEPKRKRSNIMAVLMYFILPAIVFYLYIYSLPRADELIILAIFAPMILSVAICGFVALRKRTRENFKIEAINSILACISPDIIYHNHEGLKPQNLVRSEMFPGIVSFKSEDLITGKYKHVSFSLADVASVGGILPGNADFMGRWITLDYNNKQVQDLYIYQKMQGRKTYNENAVSVQTDNPNFNDNFTVYSRSGQEALYVLTPHFMEAILRLEKSLDGAIVMGFTEGKLHVAIDDKRNHMEVDMWSKPDAYQYASDVLGDLNVVYDFIDELRLKGDS